MAIVGVVLSYSNIFSDFGINSAFVQRQGVTEAQRSSLFWFNLFASVALSLAIMALSPIVSAFYGERRLIIILVVVSTTFIFSALGLQLKLAAEKDLHFRPVILIELFAAAAGLAFSISLALNGFGVFSLVGSAVLSAALNTALTWIFLRNDWTPQLRFDFREVRPFIAFGVAIVSNNLINQVNSTIDILMAGRLLTTSQVGLYSLPRNLTLQIQGTFNPIATRVAFPLFSKIQSNKDQVKAVYLSMMNMTSSVNGPAYIFIAIFATQITNLLFGPAWAQSSTVLAILALWGLFRSTSNPVGSLLLGVGRPELALRWNLTLLLLVPPSIFFGANYGEAGIAITLACVQILLFIPNWYFLVRPTTDATFTEYIKEALLPFILAVASALSAKGAAIEFTSPTLELALGGLIFSCCYLTLSYFFNRPWLHRTIELVPPQIRHFFPSTKGRSLDTSHDPG